MILLIPFIIYIQKRLHIDQLVQMEHKDRRIKLIDEVLNGIKVLKLYAWENSFARNIINIRKDEIKRLRMLGFWNSVISFFFGAMPYLVAVVTFGCFVLLDENNVLDANTAFVSLTIFNLLRLPLNFLPTPHNT